MLSKIKSCLKDLKDLKGIDRKTVEKIDMQCGGIISNIIPTNAFTALKTGTNYKEAMSILHNEIFELEEQKNKTDLNSITKDVLKTEKFINTLIDLKKKFKIDSEKITAIHSEKRLSVYVGDEAKILVDLGEENCIIALTEYIEVFKDFSKDPTILTLLERFAAVVTTIEKPTLFIGNPLMKDVVVEIQYDKIITTLTRLKDSLIKKLISHPYDFELTVDEEWLLDIPKNKANLQLYTLLLTLIKED